MSDPHQRSMKVILISKNKDVTKFLDEQSDMHVQVNCAKVNATSCTVFADLHDMTNIEWQSGARPENSVVKEIDWDQRSGVEESRSRLPISVMSIKCQSSNSRCTLHLELFNESPVDFDIVVHMMASTSPCLLYRKNRPMTCIVDRVGFKIN